MSIRTVSQLPLYDIQNIIDPKGPSEEREKFRNSLIEVSYNKEEGKYESKRMTLGAYYDYVYYNVLSGGDSQETNFNTEVNFNELVEMYDSLHVSGDFTLNEYMDDDDAAQYKFYVKTANNVLYGTEANYLIAPYTAMRTDELNISTWSDYWYCHISRNGSWLDTPLLTLKNGNFECEGNLTGYNFNGNNFYGKDFYGDYFHGVAIKAKWADLAETYESDSDYESGTLVMFGGEKEITIAHGTANAVITTSPGFVLNGEKKGCQIALVGRTPVKVIGTIKKFDRVYLSPFDDGIGASMEYIRSKAQQEFDDNSLRPVGRALQGSGDAGIKLVECVVKMEI